MAAKTLLTRDALEKYYERGANATPQQLSRTMVRRCYYDWMKNDADTRDWEQTFQDKLLKYKKRFENIAAKRATFVPRVLGSVSLASDYSSLVIKSEYHEDLHIKTAHPSKAWARKTVKAYTNKNYCEIDFNSLLKDSVTDILTKVWI